MLGTVEIHWHRLRPSLAAFTAAALAGVAVAAAAWWHEQRVLEGMDAAEFRLAEARGRSFALAEERQKWRRFGPLYRRLTAQGRIGEEQPAQWTEAVRNAAGGIPAARHRLGSTHTVEKGGPIEVRATDISIDLEIRHEAELTRFLGALERDAPGMFTVSRCRLERPHASDAKKPQSAYVGAACRIRWQSVVLSGAEPGWSPTAGMDGGSDAGTETAASEAALVEPPRESLGRLFTTEAERARIDAARLARNATTVPDETPALSPARSTRPPRQSRWMHVGGVIHRTGRSIAAWVDGTRISYGDPHPERPSLADPRPEVGVRLIAGSRSIVVRPGQRFDPHTGAVSDRIRSPEDRFRQGRSRRESSAAPLTDPPIPGQN